MASGYKAPKDGMAAVLEKFTRLERQVAALRQALGLESAVIGAGGITVRDDGLLTFLNEDAEATMTLGRGFADLLDPKTGGAMRLRRGRIYLWDNQEANPDNPGVIMVDQGAGINYLRVFPPYSSGNGGENSITVQGRTTDDPGHVWVYSDGRTDIISPLLGLYSLPETSSGANLHLGTVGGQWTVARVTSSERYKQDIADADLEPADVLAWRPREWRDRAEVVAVGDDAAHHIGFIAEEIAETTPQFVNLDDEGRPDSLRYDRMVAGVVAVVQDQEKRIATLEQTVADQAATIADLTARLEALEARA